MRVPLMDVANKNVDDLESRVRYVLFCCCVSMFVRIFRVININKYVDNVSYTEYHLIIIIII